MSRLSTLAIVAGLLLPAFAFAQTTPAPAPSGQSPASVTATCKDGTPYSGQTRSHACQGHGGVKTWNTAAASGTAASSTAASTAPSSKTPSAASTQQAAPGGGPGQVWVNSSSKVYHCQGDKYYGKTKHGSYMTEAAAKAAGNKPVGGKACSSS